MIFLPDLILFPQFLRIFDQGGKLPLKQSIGTEGGVPRWLTDIPINQL
jgi:hypothetical protein